MASFSSGDRIAYAVMVVGLFVYGIDRPISAGEPVSEFAEAPIPALWESEDSGDWIEPASASSPELLCGLADFACDSSAESCGTCGWWTDLSQRQSLTDGIFGLQAPLADHGIGYNAALTQFYQGVADGGQEQVFRYGGKVDQFFSFDGTKLGLWKGGLVSMHVETRYGQDVNRDAVGLAPANASMLYPANDGVTSITGLTLNQFLSEEWMVSGGTFNQLDLFTQIYPQIGRGVDGFMNMSSLVPLSLARPLNLSMLGVSITKLNEGRVQGSLGVFNTANAATNSSFNKLFDNGAVILGYYRLFSNFGGLPGSHALLGVYSSGTYTSVDPTTWVILPPVAITPGKQTGTWSLTYFYEQRLWNVAGDDKRHLDLLTSWGLSDGNPNPLSWSGNIAVQGTGLVSGRPFDSVGVSYFHTALSGDFKRLASPLSPLDDVDGVELYYNRAITPWFHLTPDLQVVTPANQDLDTAVVIGIRGKITL